MKRGRIFGFVGMVLTFGCWYFYKTALASPHVVVLKTTADRLSYEGSKSSVLRKLHWVDLGDSQNKTNNTGDAEVNTRFLETLCNRKLFSIRYD